MKDIIGNTYGDFIVVRVSGKNSHGTKYECRCKLCGGKKMLMQYHLWHSPRHAEKACAAKRGGVSGKNNEKIREKPDPCGGRKDCAYWRTIDFPTKCCYYCLVNSHTRQKDENGKCLSYDASEETDNRIWRALHGLA